MSDSKKTIDPGVVRELAAILREADLGEIEVEQGELRIRVSKPTPPQAPVQTYVSAPPPAAAPVTVPAAQTGVAPAEQAPAATEHKDAITSPMVGTVYLSPEPGAPVFVQVGDAVKKGDTLMLVEAMKTFNPVAASQAGTVKEILVSDGQPVEYGEPLIVVG